MPGQYAQGGQEGYIYKGTKGTKSAKVEFIQNKGAATASHVLGLRAHVPVCIMGWSSDHTIGLVIQRPRGEGPT